MLTSNLVHTENDYGPIHLRQHNEPVPEAKQRHAMSYAPISHPSPRNLHFTYPTRTVSNPEQFPNIPQHSALRPLHLPQSQDIVERGFQPLRPPILYADALRPTARRITESGGFYGNVTNDRRDILSRFPDHLSPARREAASSPLAYDHLSSSKEQHSVSTLPPTIQGNKSRGKRNPIKKSSDDARREASIVGSQHQSSCRAVTSQTSISHAMYPLQAIPSSGSIVRSQVPQNTCNFRSCQTASHPYYLLTNQPPSTERVQHSLQFTQSHSRQSELGPETPPPSLIAVDQSSSRLEENIRDAEGLAPFATQFGGSHIVRYREDGAKLQSANENLSPSFGQAQVTTDQQSKPGNFRQRTITKPQVEASNNDYANRQHHSPRNPDSNKKHTSVKWQIKKNCKLWIAGFADDATHDAAWGLLQVCSGLQEITDPQISIKQSQTYGRGFRAYVFAT